MTKPNNPDDLSKWLKLEFAKWREQINLGVELPDALDQLLLHVSDVQLNQPVLLELEDEVMLTIIVNEALQNVDIAVRYPAFYQKLLNNLELQKAFLDALELLEADKSNQLETPTKAAAKGLSFLKEPVFPRPIISRLNRNKWQASWQIFQTQLDNLFKQPELAYRSALGLEDEGTVLLRSQFEASGRKFDMFLEAVQKLEEPSHLYLHLSTTQIGTVSEPPVLHAHLKWGENEQSAVVDKYGRARFEPVPIDTLLDETEETFRSDLQLTLETET